MQRQARQTLVVAAAFAAAAPVSAALPHDTGMWLPLHLFLVGGVLSAIVGATQLLAVTWSSAPAPPAALAHAQRWLLAAGAVAIATGREVDARGVVAAGGVAVGSALVLLVVALVRIRRGAAVDRFHPAIDAYLAAAVVGLVGATLGTLLASDAAGESYVEVRDAHVTANLFGLVGLVIAGTLPYFAATQARTKMSPHASPARLRTVTGAMGIATVVAAAGLASGSSAAAGAGLVAYALGVAGVVALLPRAGRKQFAWAGPRLVQLAAGVAWWIVATALLAAHAFDGSPARATGLRLLVVGAYAQILVASLAYFAPVLIAGGHRVLSEGFRITRSWIGLVAANVAAVGIVADAGVIVGPAVGVWLVDAVIRAVRLGLLARRSRPRDGAADDISAPSVLSGKAREHR